MSVRALAVVALFVIGAFPTFGHGASAAGGALPLDMGYSPTLLFPSSWGTPVYAAGDQLWIRSHYNATVQVRAVAVSIQSNGSSATAFARYAEPGTPVRVLTFNATDPQGFWTIEVVNASAPGLLFVLNSAARSANLSLSGYGLGRGTLDMNLTLNPQLQIYGARACVLGEDDGSTARVAVPSGIGAGYLNVSRNGGALTVEPVGTNGENFSLSVELYRSFSFLVPNSSSVVVSRATRVAATGSELVPAGRSLALQVQSDVPLGPGTYQVRAFFEGPAGVFLSSTEVLLTGGSSWLWTGACRTYPVFSGQFALSAPLGAGPSSWPRSVWLAYYNFGEEGVAGVTLGVNISAVNFVGAPWGVKLSNYSISADPKSGALEVASVNGTVYAVVSGESALIGYRVGLAGRTLFSGTAGPLLPFTSTDVNLSVSKLVVKYLVGGAGYEGGTVRVSDKTGVLASASTDSSGQAIFYIPTGSYNVTATGGNGTASGRVDAVAGQSEELVLGETGGSGLEPLLIASLAVAGVVGAVANVSLWARGRRTQSRSPSQK